MSDEKKDFTIENSAFTLTLHINTKLLSTQACIFVVCALCIKFVSNENLKSLAIVFLVLDIVSLVIGMLFGKSDKQSDKPAANENKNTSSKPKTATKETKGASEKPKRSSAPDNGSGSTIKNKLDIATPKQRVAHVTAPTPAPTPVTDQTETTPIVETVPETPVAVAEEAIPDNTPLQMSDDVRSAFEDFFSLDLDDME